jgi:drug/metabolite transporter (DMT)-like permease
MKAFVWMSGALLSLCLMAIAGRELAGAVHTFEILLVRSVVGLVIAIALICRTGRRELFTTRRWKVHAVRNAAHFIGQYGWFLGLGLLPLAQVFALEFTTPFWTLLIAAVFLKEKLTGRKFLAIALGFAGVFLILNPGREIINPASFYVLIAAVFYAGSYVATKALAPTDAPLTVLFYMNAMQFVFGLIMGLPDFVMPDSRQWCWLVLVGGSAFSAHYCMTNAMKHAEVSVVVTLDFLRLPLIALVGMLVYHEAFRPVLLAAAALMLTGNLINMGRPKKAAPA